MKTLSLSGSSRENVGKRGASELRRQERVPAVLYGGEKQIHFSLSNNDAKKLIVKGYCSGSSIASSNR